MGDGPGRGGGAAPPPPPARPGPGGRRRRCRRRLRAGGRAANGRGAPGGGGRGDAGRGRGAALGRRRSPRGGRRGGRRGRSSKPPPPTPRRRVGDAERRGTRPRLGLARLGCRGLRAARAPLPHWARKQKPRRHWAPGPAAPAPRFDKPGMERRRRRRRRGEGGKGRGPEREPPADWPIPLPWLPLLPALIGGAVSPWWKGRLRARGSDEGRPRRGWVGGGRGASGAAGSHAPRPSPGHARGWQRLPPLGARVPRRPGPGAPTCARRRRAPVPRGAPCRERRAGRRWLLLSVTVSWSRCRFVLRLARTRRAPRCSRRGCRGVSVSILQTAFTAPPSGTSDPKGSGCRLTERSSAGGLRPKLRVLRQRGFPAAPVRACTALPLWHAAQAGGALCRSL